jgi:hypothetical protein
MSLSVEAKQQAPELPPVPAASDDGVIVVPAGETKDVPVWSDRSELLGNNYTPSTAVIDQERPNNVDIDVGVLIPPVKAVSPVALLKPKVNKVTVRYHETDSHRPSEVASDVSVEFAVSDRQWTENEL